MNLKNVKMMKNLTTIMVCIAIVFAFFISGIRIFGLQVYGVLSGSMEPTYKVGSLIYVKKLGANEVLNIQDVITFQMDNKGTIATHRIVDVVGDSNNLATVQYQTKGDANQVVDSNLVSRNKILGKVVFAVPGLGNVANYIQSPPGIYVAIVISALMIGFVFLTDSMAAKLKKNEGQPQQAPQPLSPLALKINEISMKLIKKPLFKQPEQNGYPPYPQAYQQPYVQPTYQQPQQYQQAYQQPQQYQQGYQQPQQYPQQYQQGYQQPQQYPQQYQQGYQQPQQYPQQYQQGYQQPQQYPQQYQQGYQQPQQPHRRSNQNNQ